MINYPLQIRRGRDNRPIARENNNPYSGKIILFSNSNSLKVGDVVLPLKIEDRDNYYLCQKYKKIKLPFLFRKEVYLIEEGELNSYYFLDYYFNEIQYKVRDLTDKIIIEAIDQNGLVASAETDVKTVDIDILRKAEKTEEQHKQLIKNFDYLGISNNEFDYSNKYLGEVIKARFYGKLEVTEMKCSNKQILQKFEEWKKKIQELHNTVMKIMSEKRDYFKQILEETKKKFEELYRERQRMIEETVKTVKFEEVEKFFRKASVFLPTTFEDDAPVVKEKVYRLGKIEGMSKKEVVKEYLLKNNRDFKEITEKLEKLRKEEEMIKMALEYGNEHYYLFDDFITYLKLNKNRGK